MHLFRLADFGQRFGVDLTEPDFLSAVTRASAAATQDLASRFRYKSFASYGSRTDFFYVQDVHFQSRGEQRQFLLSRGFTSKAAITAYMTTSPLNFRNGSTDSLFSLKDVGSDGQSDHLMVDGDAGLMTVYGLDLRDQWVIATYTGGLNADTDDEYEDVPDWLSEAAMAQTALNLSRHRAFIPEEGQGDLSELSDAITRITRERWRYYPAAIRPNATE